jgi:hypothetical protein
VVFVGHDDHGHYCPWTVSLETGGDPVTVMFYTNACV